MIFSAALDKLNGALSSNSVDGVVLSWIEWACLRTSSTIYIVRYEFDSVLDRIGVYESSSIQHLLDNFGLISSKKIKELTKIL